MYQSAYMRYLNRMTAEKQTPTDTGFCTADSDNKNIKSTLSFSKGYESDRTLNSNTNSNDRYTYQTNVDQKSNYSGSEVNPGVENNRNVYPHRSSYLSKYLYGEPQRHGVNSITSTSETKENEAPKSILATSGYLGRYKPRYSSVSQGSESDEVFQESGSEVESNSTSPRDRYRYSSSSYYNKTSPSIVDQSNLQKTNKYTVDVTADVGSDRNNTVSNSPLEQRESAQVNTTRAEPLSPYRSYRSRSYLGTEQPQATSTPLKNDHLRSESSSFADDDKTTKYTYKYPSMAYKYSIEPNKPTEASEPSEEETVVTETYSYRYPSTSNKEEHKMSSSADSYTRNDYRHTNESSQNGDTEHNSPEMNTRYSSRYKSKACSFLNKLNSDLNKRKEEKNKEQKSLEMENSNLTSTERSSSQDLPTDTKEQSQNRYPSRGYSYKDYLSNNFSRRSDEETDRLNSNSALGESSSQNSSESRSEGHTHSQYKYPSKGYSYKDYLSKNFNDRHNEHKETKTDDSNSIETVENISEDISQSQSHYRYPRYSYKDYLSNNLSKRGNDEGTNMANTKGTSHNSSETVDIKSEDRQSENKHPPQRYNYKDYLSNNFNKTNTTDREITKKESNVTTIEKTSQNSLQTTEVKSEADQIDQSDSKYKYPARRYLYKDYLSNNLDKRDKDESLSTHTNTNTTEISNIPSDTGDGASEKVTSEEKAETNIQSAYQRYAPRAYSYMNRLTNILNKNQVDKDEEKPQVSQQLEERSNDISSVFTYNSAEETVKNNWTVTSPKSILSPALTPKSPSSRSRDDGPKYLFSVGSRTVVEPPKTPDGNEAERTEGSIEDEEEQNTNAEESQDEVVQDEVSEEAEVDPEELLSPQELLDTAKQYLEELHLKGAERLFLKCYDKLSASPEINHGMMIEIYFGLAEVCTRRSRQTRKSPLEWQWLCVHAASLLGEAIELCDQHTKREDPTEKEVYQIKREYAENRNKSLEDLLSRTLYNWLNEGWRTIDPMSAVVRNAKSKTSVTSSNFPLSNILGLKPYEPGFLVQALSIESLHEMPSSLEGVSLGTQSNWFKRIQSYCLKRLHNKDRQMVLDEVLHDSTPDPQKNESQQLGSDDEDSEITDHAIPEDTGMSTNLENDTENYIEAEDKDLDQNEDEMLEMKTEITPLSEKPVKLTIARIYHRVVGSLIKEKEYTKAELLCEEILQIIEDIQDGTVRMLKFSGELQQNLGILCLRQGDIKKGMTCLQEALSIFRDIQDGIAHREVALVLIDMGNAYVASSITKEQLYQAVISAIREFFEKEACDDNDTGTTTPEMIRSKEQEPTNDEEERKKENINEAIKCYKESLEVLEGHVDMELETIAKSLMKLGDCYFIQKEYSKALDSYEKALPTFKKANVFGKEHFLENGHVMCMLGVATFMLHVYPRAASTFEIAFSMVKHAHRLEINTFLHGLLLSLMGIANYKLKQYHKCVSMCYQAFEIFWVMHGEDVVKVPDETFWLICQNLYILGNSYNVLNLQHKAIKYLNIGRAFMRAAENGEKRQFMRILNILGDCYFAQYDYKTALVYYNEALEVGETGKEDEEVDGENLTDDEMNQSTEDMALHNQLLSKSAEANISMNQYENAIEYLEQARDMQDVLGEDIKGDLVSTLYQLGQMHSMAGDVDKAIDSYKESLEVFRELHGGKLGPEMCVTLGNLATMCYVKACICEDIDSELQMILAAEGYFQEALKLDMNQSVCVKYANFLYSQGNYDDAIMYLDDALRANSSLPEIVYGGLEKVTLPEPLQDEVDAQEEVEMPSVCLGYFLKVLCHKMLSQTRLADKSLLQLMKNVYLSDIPFLRSVLGYALMEMGLFEEAAISFANACKMDPEYNLALDNYCLCLCLMVLECLNSAMKNIFVHYKIWYEDDVNIPAIEY